MYEDSIEPDLNNGLQVIGVVSIPVRLIFVTGHQNAHKENVREKRTIFFTFCDFDIR